MSELALIVNMAFLIFAVPSAPEPWFVESSDHHSPAGGVASLNGHIRAQTLYHHQPQDELRPGRNKRT
eukprot:5446834-Amphidinium_carterae.1